MSLNENVSSLEREKFYRDLSGDVVVRTSATGTFSITGLKNGGLVTAVELNNSAWLPLPPIPLLNRNAMSIINNSGQDILINYSVTADTTLGVKILDGAERNYDVKDSIPIYGICISSNTCLVIVEELS